MLGFIEKSYIENLECQHSIKRKVEMKRRPNQSISVFGVRKLNDLMITGSMCTINSIFRRAIAVYNVTVAKDSFRSLNCSNIVVSSSFAAYSKAMSLALLSYTYGHTKTLTNNNRF